MEEKIREEEEKKQKEKDMKIKRTNMFNVFRKSIRLLGLKPEQSTFAPTIFEEDEASDANEEASLNVSIKPRSIVRNASSPK